MQTNLLDNALANVANDQHLDTWDFLSGIAMREDSPRYQQRLESVLAEILAAANKDEQLVALDVFAAELMRARTYVALDQLLFEPENERTALEN